MYLLARMIEVTGAAALPLVLTDAAADICIPLLLVHGGTADVPALSSRATVCRGDLSVFWLRQQGDIQFSVPLPPECRRAQHTMHCCSLRYDAARCAFFLFVFLTETTPTAVVRLQLVLSVSRRPSWNLTAVDVVDVTTFSHRFGNKVISHPALPYLLVPSRDGVADRFSCYSVDMLKLGTVVMTDAVSEAHRLPKQLNAIHCTVFNGQVVLVWRHGAVAIVVTFTLDAMLSTAVFPQRRLLQLSSLTAASRVRLSWCISGDVAAEHVIVVETGMAMHLYTISQLLESHAASPAPLLELAGSTPWLMLFKRQDRVTSVAERNGAPVAFDVVSTSMSIPDSCLGTELDVTPLQWHRVAAIWSTVLSYLADTTRALVGGASVCSQAWKCAHSADLWTAALRSQLRAVSPFSVVTDNVDDLLPWYKARCKLLSMRTSTESMSVVLRCDPTRRSQFLCDASMSTVVHHVAQQTFCLVLQRSRSGSCMWTLPFHCEPPSVVALSLCGQLLAYASAADNTLSVHRLSQRRNALVATIRQAHSGTISFLQFLENGQKLCSACSLRRELRVWDLQTLQCVSEKSGEVLRDSSAALRCLAPRTLHCLSTGQVEMYAHSAWLALGRARDVICLNTSESAAVCCVSLAHGVAGHCRVHLFRPSLPTVALRVDAAATVCEIGADVLVFVGVRRARSASGKDTELIVFDFYGTEVDRVSLPEPIVQLQCLAKAGVVLVLTTRAVIAYTVGLQYQLRFAAVVASLDADALSMTVVVDVVSGASRRLALYVATELGLLSLPL